MLLFKSFFNHITSSAFVPSLPPHKRASYWCHHWRYNDISTTTFTPQYRNHHHAHSSPKHKLPHPYLRHTGAIILITTLFNHDHHDQRRDLSATVWKIDTVPEGFASMGKRNGPGKVATSPDPLVLPPPTPLHSRGSWPNAGWRCRQTGECKWAGQVTRKDGLVVKKRLGILCLGLAKRIHS